MSGPPHQGLGRALLALLAIAVLAFLCLPIAIVVPMSFSGADTLAFPPPSLSLRWYEDFFGNGRWVDAGLNSLALALLSSSLSINSGPFVSIRLQTSARNVWDVSTAIFICASRARRFISPASDFPRCSSFAANRCWRIPSVAARAMPRETAALPTWNQGKTADIINGNPAPSSHSRWEVGTVTPSSRIGALALPRSPNPLKPPLTPRPGVSRGT